MFRFDLHESVVPLKERVQQNFVSKILTNPSYKEDIESTMIPMSMWWYNKGKRKDGTFCPTQKESKRLHDVRNLLETLQGFEDVNNDHRQSFRKFLNSIDFLIYLYRFFLQKNTSRFNSNSKTSSYQWTNSTTFTIFSQMVILRRQCY